MLQPSLTDGGRPGHQRGTNSQLLSPELAPPSRGLSLYAGLAAIVRPGGKFDEEPTQFAGITGRYAF